jgi:hypothetical protein
MKKTFYSLCFMLCVLSAAPAALAQEDSYPSFDLGGLIFGDAYYVPSHHLEEGDGAAGLFLRRAYLTLDAEFSQHWFARARLEINQDGDFETYEFDGDWKDLYLGVELGRHKVLAGLAPTPTFDLIESIWGARYLARTPMDMQGIASRDTGISARGPLNASGTLGYRAMWAAPVEFGKESNPNDRLMAAVSWSPRNELTFDFYIDFEDRDEHHDRTTVQAFVGYDTDPLRWGLQYSKQDRQDDPSLELASGFVAVGMGEKSSLIGRIDRIIEPSPRGDDISYIPFDPSAPATMYIGAWEYRLLPNLTLTPNFIVIDYDRNEEGQQPETDVHLRLTAYFKF